MPERLPRTVDDLADWSVYADALMSAGDGFGEYLAADLAVPARPTTAELAAFKELAAARCTRGSQRVDTSWSLGFVRELALFDRRTTKSGVPHIEDGTLANVTDRLATRAYARLAVLHVPVLPVGKHLRRLFAALPVTCTRVDTSASRAVRTDLPAFIAALPPQVTELAISTATEDQLRAAITDRFQTVDLMRVAAWTEIDAALRASDHVRVRMHHVDGDHIANERLVTMTDYGFVRPRDRRVRTGRPVVLLELQRRNGFIPIRAQLARTLPVHSHFFGVNVRCLDGRWTLKREADDVVVAFDRRLLRLDEIVELHDGDVVGFTDGDEVFYTHDILQRARGKAT